MELRTDRLDALAEELKSARRWVGVDDEDAADGGAAPSGFPQRPRRALQVRRRRREPPLACGRRCRTTSEDDTTERRRALIPSHEFHRETSEQALARAELHFGAPDTWASPLMHYRWTSDFQTDWKQEIGHYLHTAEIHGYLAPAR